MAEIENINEEEEQSINFRDILSMVIGYWKWILLSVVICLGIGFYRYLCTPKIYNRSAILLIKDDSKSQGISSDVASMFSNMGVGGSQTNVNNELAALQAPANIMEAGKRLGLDMSYTVPGAFQSHELYGKTLPVNVRFMGLTSEETAALELKLKADGSFSLSKFRLGGDSRTVNDDNTVVNGVANSVVNTPIGKVMVTPTTYYGKFIGHDIKPITVVRSTLYNMTTAIGANLSADLDNKQATVINIAYKDRIPERAVDVINMLITVYKEAWVKDKNEMAIATSKFITKRLAEIEQNLGGLDADISSFKSTHLIPDEQYTAQLYLQQSRDNSKEMLSLSTQRSLAEYVRSMLLKDVHSRQLLPANSGIDNQAVETQISTYNNLLLDRNQLAANSSNKNPLVEDYDQQLASMRKAIVQSLNNLVAGIDTQVGQAQATENQTNSRIASVPTQSKYLQTVGRKQKVMEQLYLFLLQKREETELSQAFTAYNVRLLSAPFGSMAPISPKRNMILLISLIIGLAIPIGIIVVRAGMNTKLRGKKDLENITVPFIGEIPLAEKRRFRLPCQKKVKQHETIVVKEGEHDVINEAFRVLRTKLEIVMPGNRKENAILVTSFNPNSGKSFLCANIAMSLAIKQKKVLIIDCDLRKGAVSQLVGSPKVGLTHYLTGRDEDPSQLIKAYQGSSNLSILPIGVIPPNPAELLSNGRLEALLAELRPQFDYIFLDCPPIEVVADTEIISRYADRTIFIVRAGLLERSMLPELEKLYKDNKYRNMLLILNGTDGVSPHHGYGYRYGYGYGYGYGNYNAKK